MVDKADKTNKEKQSLLTKIETLTPLHRNMIFAGVFVLLSIAFYFVIYLPMNEEIDRISNEINSLQSRLAAARVQIRKMNEVEAGLKDVEERFQAALALLPEQREIPSLLKNITITGRGAGLDFVLFSPQPEEFKEFYIEIPVAIEVHGNFNEVLTFFDEVGRMERIVTVSDVNIVPEKPLSTRLKTVCKAITYRFKSEADEKAEAERKQQEKKKKLMKSEKKFWTMRWILSAARDTTA